MLSSEARGAKHPVLGGAGHPEEGFPCPTPTAQRQVTPCFPKAQALMLPRASEAPLSGTPFPSFFIWLAPICSLHLPCIPSGDYVLISSLAQICHQGPHIPMGEAFGAMRGRNCDSPAGPSPSCELLEGRVQAHRRALGKE